MTYVKFFLSRILLLAALCSAIAGSRAAQTQSNDAPLTNASIVKLVRAGFKEKTILSIIAARPAAYDLSPDRMIELKKNGVSERIILGMLARQTGGDVADDNWGDDPFFNDSAAAKDTQKPDKNNGPDIFGSSGSSQQNSRSRGGNSSASGDTETVGSATVRIIKPPAEAGAPPKLEKTPSLTNDSIIELVEAGFSDGTIIRRIEQSPVDFDLSPEKLTELRKHRVSDKVLAAMKAAMGEDSKTDKTGNTSNATPGPK